MLDETRQLNTEEEISQWLQAEWVLTGTSLVSEELTNVLAKFFVAITEVKIIPTSAQMLDVLYRLGKYRNNFELNVIERINRAFYPLMLCLTDEQESLFKLTFDRIITAKNRDRSVRLDWKY